jgi:hypothetical protein
VETGDKNARHQPVWRFPESSMLQALIKKCLDSVIPLVDVDYLQTLSGYHFDTNTHSMLPRTNLEKFVFLASAVNKPLFVPGILN